MAGEEYHFLQHVFRIFAILNFQNESSWCNRLCFGSWLLVSIKLIFFVTILQLCGPAAPYGCILEGPTIGRVLRNQVRYALRFHRKQPAPGPVQACIHGVVWVPHTDCTECCSDCWSHTVFCRSCAMTQEVRSLRRRWWWCRWRRRVTRRGWFGSCASCVKHLPARAACRLCRQDRCRK